MELRYQIILRSHLLCVPCSLQQVMERVLSLSRDESLQNDQCLIMFVLSHGNVRDFNGRKVDCIYGSDGEWLRIDEILSPFTNASCPFLNSKPKLMFFQACRGGNNVFVRS